VIDVAAVRETAVLLFEEYVGHSHAARTISDLTIHYSRAIAALGYENCVLTSLRGRRVGHVAWFELPVVDSTSYFDQRWRRIDCALDRARRRCRPFAWGEAIEGADLRDDIGRAPRQGNAGMAESGLAFPFHAPGHRVDIMSISRRVGSADASCSALLGAISFHAWTRYFDLSQDPPAVEPDDAVLTPRELEILDWCKKGKTRPEIGKILSISRKTVEFHLSNVMAKLGAGNQMAAVVIALQRGLIEL
jgi:DNA-binding CsgD family transcriptional regulator